ncbi:MAG: RNA polymerase sigma factor [Cyclobacteriaceae bacterium]|nr:RNA polymerase sigma factor [Cyclobacteriaceae bacterium]
MTAIEFTHQLSGLTPTLQSFTRRFTNNREESDDLVQETLLKAFACRDTFRENTNLKGWLFTIMRNTFINMYRRQKRARTATDDTKELYFLNVEDRHTFNKPESTFEYNDILRHINAIDSDLREPFMLHTNGYKYHEIAKDLDLPIGTVKNRIFHARKEIQKRLTGY